MGREKEGRNDEKGKGRQTNRIVPWRKKVFLPP